MTPTAEERRRLQLLAESGQAIADGVARELPGWVERQVTRILDAWGRADAAALVSNLEVQAQACRYAKSQGLGCTTVTSTWTTPTPTPTPSGTESVTPTPGSTPTGGTPSGSPSPSVTGSPNA